MKTSVLAVALAGVAAAVLGSAQANAAPFSPNLVGNPMLIEAADGCGVNSWRGPGGHCHWAHYDGWGPNGYYASGPYRVQAGPFWNASCPPGSWRGPWGHCRDTPYHGPLPDGGYRP
jgi:hypothetical protein